MGNNTNIESICQPLTIELSDDQFNQLDHSGLTLKSETNEISIPPGNALQSLEEILKQNEPDEITQEIALKDRLVQARDLNSFLYETIGSESGSLSISASARRGLGEVILHLDSLLEDGVELS